MAKSYTPSDTATAAVSVSVVHPDSDSASDEAVGGFPAQPGKRCRITVTGDTSVSQTGAGFASSAWQWWTGSSWASLYTRATPGSDTNRTEVVEIGDVPDLSVVKVRVFVQANASLNPGDAADASGQIDNWSLRTVPALAGPLWL